MLAMLAAKEDPAVDKQEGLWRRALQQAPKSPVALKGLAWTLIENGRGAEALPLAARAIERAPWDWRAIDTYAAALFVVGRCREAAATEKRALDQVSESERAHKDIAAIEKNLAMYQQTCPEDTP